MRNENTITLSIKQIFLIITVLLLLFFTVIRPSIARNVCYTEALRRDLGDFFANPVKSRQNRKDMETNVDRLYKECKTYNAGKIWDQFLFNDMKL